ncbi:hypothetical protein ACWGDS_41335 [Streptomyces sp. NPDC055059]|uniref:hypothetical protein n=1 Tax=Streptomyces sp. NPDC127172 TaxID=3345382 RepID=UPI00363BBB81
MSTDRFLDAEGGAQLRTLVANVGVGHGLLDEQLDELVVVLACPAPDDPLLVLRPNPSS